MFDKRYFREEYIVKKIKKSLKKNYLIIIMGFLDLEKCLCI